MSFFHILKDLGLLCHHENVLLIGNSGTGKTHLATSLGFAACCQGYKVRFFGCTSLVTQLLEAREERQLQRLLNQFEKHNLLILDELGYVPFSKAGSELLTGAMLDQLTHKVHIIEANGASYRLEQNKKGT